KEKGRRPKPASLNQLSNYRLARDARTVEPLKYRSANVINTGQFGAGVCPAVCCRNDTSPSISGVSIGGNSLVPSPFLPSSLYTGSAPTPARNDPFASTHPSPAVAPALRNTGRGAHNAISSCESTGRSFTVSGPEYLRKLAAIQ